MRKSSPKKLDLLRKTLNIEQKKLTNIEKKNPNCKEFDVKPVDMTYFEIMKTLDEDIELCKKMIERTK